MKAAKENKDVSAATQKALDEIARHALGIETLETRRRDCLDFHDVAVWQIRQILAAAYRLGRADRRG